MKKTLLAMLAAPLFLIACSDNNTQNNAQQNSETTTASAPATTGKQYVVVSQPSYPPFATRNEKGDLVGLDMDLLNAIAQKENISFKFVPHIMTGLLETVNTGEADIVATGVNITPEREQLYTFSKPYLDGNWVALLDKTQSQYTSWAELQNKPIAVQLDSLSQTQLEKTTITPNPVVVKTVHLGVNAVDLGQAAAVYDVDAVLNTYFLKSGSKYYTVVDEKSGKVPFAWVLKKGNTELKAILDKGLDDLKADGTYEQLLKKWNVK